MPRYNGVAYIFGTCEDHTVREVGTAPDPTYFSTLSNLQKAKAEHIHCYECGCLKSRGPCPMFRFTYEPSPLTPDYDSLEERPKSVLKDTGNMLDQLDRLEPVDAVGEAQDGSPVALEMANNVRFDIQWATYEKAYQIEGDLPAELASQVIDLVRNYRQH